MNELDDQALNTEESPSPESHELDTDTLAPATEGASDPTSAQDVADEPEGGAEPGPIPYSRFKVVNDQFKALKAQKDEEAALLREFGFESLSEMREAAAAEQQRLEEERVKAFFASQVEDGEMDEVTAAARRDLELERMAFNRERAMVQEFMILQARDAALASHPEAKEAPEAVDDLIRSGMDPRKAAAHVASLVKRFSLAAQSQATAKRPPAPSPMGTDNQSAQPVKPVSGLERLRQGASVNWRDLIMGGNDTV